MQMIREYVGDFLKGVTIENIRPSSLDLTLTDEMYRVSGAFLPSRTETVWHALQRAGSKKIPSGSILERGSCYVCKLAESIKKLPSRVYSYANPKSSSGRLDIHVRLLVDKVPRYDSIPRGYEGPLWLLIAPKKFSVITPPGTALNQIRFFTQDTRLDEDRLELAFEKDGGFLCDKNGKMISYRDDRPTDRDGSVILTLDLDSDLPGFEACDVGEPIDLSLEKQYFPETFFRPLSVINRSITLNANAFYILSTKEHVRVPPKYACEMAPMDERSGEMRSHYAGFIDPGWGYGEDGSGKGRQLTLEVRSFDNGLIILDGQPIAKIRYERMKEKPEKHYGEIAGSNYVNQSGPGLSKHFRPWSK